MDISQEYLPVLFAGRRRHIRKGKTKKTVTVMTGDSWSDTESDEEKKAEADFGRDASSTASFEQTFLRSLSPSCPEYQRHSDAKQFIGKLFKKNKTDLCGRLYRIFNEKIFALKVSGGVFLKRCRLRIESFLRPVEI
jgi:hypothetical protein